MKKTILSLALIVMSLGASAQLTLPINPDKDNSIYSESLNSNGLGELFSGTTCSGNNRRALIHFDIAGALPPGATITSVSLDLTVSNAGTGSTAEDYNLHPVIIDWGEGTSSGTGTGAPAIAPDATWVDAMFGTSAWTSAGGDFGPSIAMTTLPAGTGTFTWTSPAMVTNVQTWLDTPGSNFGWILIGDEVATCTARRFGSKDAGTAPVLSVTYICTDAPTAVCQSVNVYLDGTGNATILDSDLDGGSVAVCGGNLTFSASQTAFSCSDVTGGSAASLVISSVYDGPLTGGLPKGVELYVINDIADLSIYGISSANNGTGTTVTPEFTFPSVSVTAGSYIYVASDAIEFTNWFGFAPDYTSGAANINGDDAMELYMNGLVIDVFGDVNVDGSGQPWEYMDGWAYRVSSTGPDGTTFNIGNWTLSGINALDGETDNATAVTPIPVGTYTTPPTAGLIITLTVEDEFTNQSTCDASIFVLDTIPPSVVCVGPTTMLLDGTGNLSITPGDIDNGSTDPCAPLQYTISQSTFTCADIGLVPVTLTVTDVNGNVSSCIADITIDGSNVISLTTDGITDLLCFGDASGEILITTVGGAPTVTYDWDNDGTGDFDDTEDLTGLSGGDYTVVASDANGCTATMTYTVFEPNELLVAVNPSDVTCPGLDDGSVLITVIGGVVIYTYDWDIDGTGDYDDTDDIFSLAAGNYSLSVMDGNGCLFDTLVTINDATPIDITLSQNGLDLTSNEAGATYQWLDCSDYSVISGETNQTYTVLANGSYAAMITNGSSCVDTSECITITDVSVLENPALTVMTYPNPSTGLVYVDLSAVNGEVEIVVFDTKGGQIIRTMSSNQIEELDLSQIENGIYFIHVKTDNDFIVEKLTIER